MRSVRDKNFKYFLIIYCPVIMLGFSSEVYTKMTNGDNGLNSPAMVEASNRKKIINNNILKREKQTEDIGIFVNKIVTVELKNKQSPSSGPFPIFALLNCGFENITSMNFQIVFEDYIVLGAFNLIAFVQKAKRNNDVF